MGSLGGREEADLLWFKKYALSTCLFPAVIVINSMAGRLQQEWDSPQLSTSASLPEEAPREPEILFMAGLESGLITSREWP